MNLEWSGAALTFSLLSIIPAPARAQDAEVPRPVLVFESGVALSGLTLVPLPYADASVEGQFSRHFGWGANAGAGFGLGWLLGAIGRVTSPSLHGTRISAGLGPMLTADGTLGTLPFATADLAVESRSPGGFVFVAGLRAAFVLESAGVVTCSVDTCSGSHLSAGDSTLMFRFGIGGDL